MHETVICKKIIEQAKQAQPDQAIKAIEIEVGELADLTASEVEETMKQLTDWEIKVNFVKNKIKCNCGYSGGANIVEKGHGFCVFNCPECKGKPEVLEGGHIKIIGIE